jgi:predicted nucleic acid-binding protein
VKYLLDTCLISELVKKSPNARVLGWLDKQDEDQLYLSALTIGELQKGISKLADVRKKEELQIWLSSDLVSRFERRILNIDTEVAVRWGELIGEAERRGKRLPVIDSLIAATAVLHNLTVVTRNTGDLEKFAVRVLNPWKN